MPKRTKKRQTKKSSAKSAGPGIPVPTRDRNFYAIRLQPGERVTIGEMLPKGVMGVQNHGGGRIRRRIPGDQRSARPCAACPDG